MVSVSGYGAWIDAIYHFVCSLIGFAIYVLTSCRNRMDNGNNVMSTRTRSPLILPTIDMLPPLDLSTSRDNPEFAILHKRLTNLLGVDGAVRLSAEESTKQAAVEEVHNSRSS